MIDIVRAGQVGLDRGPPLVVLDDGRMATSRYRLQGPALARGAQVIQVILGVGRQLNGVERKWLEVTSGAHNGMCGR